MKFDAKQSLFEEGKMNPVYICYELRLHYYCYQDYYSYSYIYYSYCFTIVIMIIVISSSIGGGGGGGGNYTSLQFASELILIGVDRISVSIIFTIFVSVNQCMFLFNKVRFLCSWFFSAGNDSRTRFEQPQKVKREGKPSKTMASCLLGTGEVEGEEERVDIWCQFNAEC